MATDPTDDAALLDDIATTLGRDLTTTETAQATLWLGQARAIIKAELGDLDALDQDNLATVLVEAVANRIKSPDRITTTSKQVSVDDASVQNSSTIRATGAIDIEQWMWDLLTPETTGGAFSVMPHFDSDSSSA